MLQTEGYMRAGATYARDPDEFVRQRLARRSILNRRDDPPFLWVVLDEAVIRRPCGGLEVMYEQLDHLLAMGEHSHVTIQVVPESEGAHLGMDGPLILLAKPEGKSVGYIEAQLGGRLIEDPPDVVRLGIQFDRIRARALSVGASRRLIRTTMENMRNDPLAEEQP